MHIVGITEHPTAASATQSARNFLTDPGERADQFGYLIRDRESIFTDAFDAVFTAEDIEIEKSAPQTPRMNAFAEHWTKTVRAECTDPMLITTTPAAHTRVTAWTCAHHWTTTPSHSRLAESPERRSSAG